MLTQITTDMLKGAESLILNPGDVLTFDGTKWVAQPGVPVGTVLPFAGPLPPPGWLLCAGQQVSRASYAGLFAVLGLTYGGGDGSTTFHLPDLRGRSIFGMDNMGGTDAGRLSVTNNLGDGGGAQLKSGTTGATTLSVGQMPSHKHTPSYVLCMDGTKGGVNYGGGSRTLYQTDVNGTDAAGSSQSHDHTISNLDVMPPYLLLNWMIKA